MQPLIKPNSELHPITVKPQVWTLVGIDLVGPLKKTLKGNQFILTMTCYFSKWVEAFPLPDKSAESVARAIHTSYCRHGAPENIITDQGREFVNKVIFTLKVAYGSHVFTHVRFHITVSTYVYFLIRSVKFFIRLLK